MAQTVHAEGAQDWGTSSWLAGTGFLEEEALEEEENCKAWLWELAATNANHLTAHLESRGQAGKRRGFCSPLFFLSHLGCSAPLG